jgi:RimJ/RimL family protein N-acetyltransferase
MAVQWPAEGLTIRSPVVRLAPVSEALLPAVLDALPDDLELDPAVPLGPGTRAAGRRAAYEHALRGDRASFTVDAWKLHLVVRRPGGDIVGLQTVEAERFPSERTVDSASWLVPAERGRGLGTAMREAMLSFAFGPLGARAAVSSAWRDNAASLGVSTRLGYRFERVSVLETPERQGELVHVRLDRAAWLDSGRGREVDVRGVQPELFGA